VDSVLLVEGLQFVQRVGVERAAEPGLVSPCAATWMISITKPASEHLVGEFTEVALPEQGE